MEERAWRGTGQTQYVDPSDYNRTPEFDPRTGDHLWIILSTYRWGGPTVERPTLDTENLLAVVGPGCYFCEQRWTEHLSKRRCKGRP